MDKNILITRIKDFYSDFDNKSIDQLHEIYSDDIRFRDPFHEIHGIDNLKSYFQNMASNMNYCRFTFENEAHNGNSVFLQWTMQYSHPAVKHGTPLSITGISRLDINEKILVHHDFFDAANMLYKHLPVLGSVIRFIEKRMSV